MFGGAIGLLATWTPDLLGFLIIALAILAGWVRIDLDPPIHIDLSPLLMFVALLISGPPVALFASVASALVSSKFFNKSPWVVTGAEIGEEGIAVIPAVVVAERFHVTANSLGSLEGFLAFYLSVTVYIFIRLILGAARSYVLEGIGRLSFARNAGKWMAGHLSLLALLAIALTTLYARVGYLGLLLAPITLIEFYIPGKLIGEQRNLLFANLEVMAQAIDLKDPYTGFHVHSVQKIAIRTARAMQLPESEVRRIRFGALMHDYGKVSVSRKIIRKPGKLDADEWAIMKQHPARGAEIMQPLELLSEAAEIVRHHHENYDGSGYPEGLKDEEIPVGSRIIMVADSYHAITSDRPYRKRRSKEEALVELRKGAGTQFDPKVVKAFESIIYSL
jgi:hypothetical protein